MSPNIVIDPQVILSIGDSFKSVEEAYGEVLKGKYFDNEKCIWGTEMVKNQVMEELEYQTTEYDSQDDKDLIAISKCQKITVSSFQVEFSLEDDGFFCVLEKFGLNAGFGSASEISVMLEVSTIELDPPSG